jgi:hypothetical protein
MSLTYAAPSELLHKGVGLGFESPVAGSRFQISVVSKFPVSGSRFQVSGVGVRIPGLWFPVSGVDFRFDFPVSG